MVRSVIVELLYLILPGLFANMAPVLVKKIPFLDYPVDFNCTLYGEPLFGKHKTYRGFFFGILFAIFIMWIQQMLYQYSFFQGISLMNYSATNIWLVGFLIGFGVLFGDLVKSFFKRRLRIALGARWFPWDQVDGLIGGLVFLSLVYFPGWTAVAYLILLVIILHTVLNRLGYLLGLKKVWW